MRVAWIALVIAKYERIEETGHILKLALVHDISEIRTWDTNYISRQYTVRNEEKAIQDSLDNTVLIEEFFSIWKEVEEKKTVFAQIVKDADNLDVDLEIVEKMYEWYTLPSMWKKHRLDNVWEKLFTETAKKMQCEIYELNPHDWHFLSDQNRFRGGDMKI